MVPGTQRVRCGWRYAALGRSPAGNHEAKHGHSWACRRPHKNSVLKVALAPNKNRNFNYQKKGNSRKLNFDNFLGATIRAH